MISYTSVALLWMTIVALVDALLGPRLILVGLLVGGPALAALSCQPRPVMGVSAIAVALSFILGAPDHMWLAREHAIWISAVVTVGVVNTTVVSVVAPAVNRRRLQP